MKNDPTITAKPTPPPRCAVTDCGAPAAVTISSRQGGGITPLCVADAEALFRATCRAKSPTTLVVSPIGDRS